MSRASILSLPVLAMILTSFCAAQTRPTDDQTHLRATVQKIVTIPEFTGRIIPVAVDPRFAMTVHVESAVPPSDTFAPGSVVTLGIHSPSLLFLEDKVEGKTWDFILYRQTENGKTRYWYIELQSAQAYRKPAPTTRPGAR